MSFDDRPSLPALDEVPPRPSYDKFKDLLRQQEELFQHQRELYMNELNSTGVKYNNWSFTQGLLIGQLSVFVVIAIFIKFFVFAEPSAIEAGSSKLKDGSGVIVKRQKKKKDNGSTTDENDSDSSRSKQSNVISILEKTYYDVNHHRPESLDWFNVLIAQMISQLRSEALMKDNIYHSLNQYLSNADMPDYLDKIKLAAIDVGDDFPIFSNCRIQNRSGRLEAKIDVDLSDTLTLGIETKLLLNHPLPLTAVLPVSLSVSIVRFSGCLSVSLINTNDQDFTETNGKNSDETDVNDDSLPEGTALMFSFAPDYRLEFTVKSLIGARAKLQDVPKISSLIESKLRSWFIERCIEPKFQVIKLPSLWPRSKNTREPVETERTKTESSVTE